MIKFLKNLFGGSTMSYQQRQIEKYLANSVDRVDLERRQREITHGRIKF
jgi:hypothetical protein